MCHLYQYLYDIWCIDCIVSSFNIWSGLHLPNHQDLSTGSGMHPWLPSTSTTWGFSLLGTELISCERAGTLQGVEAGPQLWDIPMCQFEMKGTSKKTAERHDWPKSTWVCQTFELEGWRYLRAITDPSAVEFFTQHPPAATTKPPPEVEFRVASRKAKKPGT